MAAEQIKRGKKLFRLHWVGLPAQPPARGPLPNCHSLIPGTGSRGPRLFPTNIITGYHANLTQYKKESWAQYVKGQCERFSACTSSITYSGKKIMCPYSILRFEKSINDCFVAVNLGTPPDRFWFGYAFRGGATTEADYARVEGFVPRLYYVYY